MPEPAVTSVEFSAPYDGRVQPSAALRGNDALLRTLDLHSEVSVSDCSGRIINVNDNFCRISGYSREELLGQTHSILNAGVHTPAFWSDMWHMIAAGQPWRGEICNRAKTGSLYWVDCLIAPFMGPNGLAEQFVSVRTDITSAKLTEHRLRASETFLDRTGRIAGIGGWQFDFDTRLIAWSAHMNRIHETPLTYRPTLEQGLAFYTPRSRPAIEAALNEAERSGTGWDLELQLTTAKGRGIWVRSVGTVECVEGRPVSVIGSTQDISMRKRVEAQLQMSSNECKRTELELVEASSMLRTVLASASEICVIATDPRMTIKVFNSGAEQLLGYTSEEVVERSALMLVHEQEELRLRAEELGVQPGPGFDGREALVDPSMLGRAREWSYVRKDGDSVAVSLVMSAMNTEAGALLGYLGVAHDVTQQKRHEESLRLATLRAENANRAKSEFLANMSHEIRTPMNAVIGLSYLLGRTKLDAEQRDLLSKIQASSDSLLAVITDVLDLTKIEAGELIVERMAFNPHMLLRQLFSIMSMQAHTKGIAFEVDVTEELPEVLEGDATRLNQILTNLISNAIKFTEQGCVTVTVRRLEAGGKGVTLSFVVRDTGIGIAPEAQARLFAPFAQADASITRRYGGTGLGLSIVKSLANILGGDVQLHSTPGQGSEFTVVLEFALAAPAAMVIQKSSPLSAVELALGGVRVLVVDDSDINLNVTKRILELDGAQVWLAGNGLEAIERLRAQPYDFDVVLMDVQMPVLDGHKATRRIRAELGLVDLPIIALTAGALSSERQRAIEAGMDDFIIKPFDRQTLARSIRRHVEISGLHAATPIGTDIAPPTPTQPPWPLIDGIDCAEAHARLCGDSSLFSSSLKRLLDEFSDMAIPAAPDDATLAAYNARLHKLTGSAGMLGATAIHKLAVATRAACVAGEMQRAHDLVAELTVQLQRLRHSAAPVLQAARAPDEISAPGDGDLTASQLLDFIRILRLQGLSALNRFAPIAPQLRSLLGHDSFEIIREHMDNLRFVEAADALQQLQAPH